MKNTHKAMDNPKNESTCFNDVEPTQAHKHHTSTSLSTHTKKIALEKKDKEIFITQLNKGA